MMYRFPSFCLALALLFLEPTPDAEPLPGADTRHALAYELGLSPGRRQRLRYIYIYIYTGMWRKARSVSVMGIFGGGRGSLRSPVQTPAQRVPICSDLFSRGPPPGLVLSGGGLDAPQPPGLHRQEEARERRGPLRDMVVVDQVLKSIGRMGWEEGAMGGSASVRRRKVKIEGPVDVLRTPNLGKRIFPHKRPGIWQGPQAGGGHHSQCWRGGLPVPSPIEEETPSPPQRLPGCVPVNLVSGTMQPEVRDKLILLFWGRAHFSRLALAVAHLALIDSRTGRQRLAQRGENPQEQTAPSVFMIYYYHSFLAAVGPVMVAPKKIERLSFCAHVDMAFVSILVVFKKRKLGEGEVGWFDVVGKYINCFIYKKDKLINRF